MPSRRVAYLATLILIVAGLASLGATERRVHLWQTKIAPGTVLEVDGLGRIDGRASGALVCRQLGWHGVHAVVYNYSANNVLGRDECPLIYAVTK